MAIRGQLASADPHDEPVSELLQDVVSRSSLGGEPRAAKLVDEDGIFEVPEHWAWVNLGALTHIVMGQSPPGSTYNKSGEGLPLINGPVEFTGGPFGRTVINQFTSAPTKTCEEDDFLLCVRGSTTGRTNIAAFRACIGRGVAAIQPLFPDQYVRVYVAHLRETIIAMGRGIAFPSISRRQIEQIPIPLPPLKEQGRIVAKVDELMALCDELEEAQRARERRRDRLATASQRRLVETTADPEAFRNSARFYLERLPRLGTRPEHISELRRTILDLAVRGHLVSGRPTAEPASELLERLQAKSTGRGNDVSIGEDPFWIPSHWAWVSIGLATRVEMGQSPPSEHYNKVGEGMPFYQGKADFGLRYPTPRSWCTAPKKVAERGDVLISVRAPVGPTNVANETACIGRGLAALRPHDEMDREFLLLCLRARESDLAELGFGTTFVAITKKQLVSFPLPLAPLEEQHLVVAKVDELMAVCDELEDQLRKDLQKRARLLEAVIHEALEPAS